MALMNDRQDLAGRDKAALFLNCPRCGLSIKPKARWLAPEHCPRCLARARIPVRLFSSTLPAAELYDDNAAPNGEPWERTQVRTR
jgi:hypothetical protein